MKKQMIAALALTAFSAVAHAAIDKPIEELPQDAKNIVSIGAEPIKGMAEGIRRFDPISGLWLGLLQGSVRSLERTAGLLWSSEDDSDASPDKALIRYSF